METLDWIILFVALAVVGYAIVVGISAALDKRLGNVAVKLPPSVLPMITVKIQKGCGNSDDYSVYVEKKGEKGNEIEHFEFPQLIQQRDSAPLPPSEVFQWEPPPVSPTLGEGAAVQQLLNSEMPYSTKEPQMIYGNPAFTNFMPNDYNSVQYPDSDDMLIYGHCKEPPKQEVPPPLEKMRISHDINNDPNVAPRPNTYDPLHAPACNKSLTEQRKDAYQYMVDNGKRYIYDNGQCDSINRTCGDECNVIGSNCVSNNYTRNFKNVYQKEQRFIPASLEDSMVRGANIGSFGEYDVYTDIGKINLSRDTVFPQPSNYIFKSSGVYRR